MSLIRRLFFELAYLRHPPWDTHISPPELIEFLESHPPGRALDLGCGTGTNLVTLARWGWQAAGVDFSLQAVWAAQKQIKSTRLTAKVFRSDVAKLDWLTGPFELVLDIGCYHSLFEASRVTYRQNLLRLLTPGGCYLMYAHWKQDGSSATGISQHDLDSFGIGLTTIKETGGVDRGGRGSIWVQYQKPPFSEPLLDSS